MYVFRSFSRKAIKFVPVLLACACAFHFLGPFWKALSLTLFLVCAEIAILYAITNLYHKNGMENEGSEPLTKSKTVRTSIVRDFAKRYDLKLADEQIDLIVRASYSSPEWEDEIQMMAREYSVINQWYVSGSTEWLHLYLKAFRNVSITSDFEVQRDMAMKAFLMIVAEPFSAYRRIRDCIDHVNGKYDTAFDEISFMMTCKYMKELGYEVNLPDGIMNGKKPEINDMIKRWDSLAKDEPRENPELRKTLEQGRKAVQMVKEANVFIPGEEMSAKLSRLEQALTQIFAVVEKHPEKLEDVHRFMNYYLPSILKVVETYKEFEIQKVRGDSTDAAKREIEDNMDPINSALENLVSKLYETASMDVSVELSVLNTLMASDGLKKGDFEH